jgi:hypothetical protein
MKRKASDGIATASPRENTGWVMKNTNPRMTAMPATRLPSTVASSKLPILLRPR